MTLGGLPLRTAFVVWVGRDANGHFEGFVERARTGEKHRFDGLDSLAGLIARITDGAEAETANGEAKPDEE